MENSCPGSHSQGPGKGWFRIQVCLSEPWAPLGTMDGLGSHDAVDEAGRGGRHCRSSSKVRREVTPAGGRGAGARRPQRAGSVVAVLIYGTGRTDREAALRAPLGGGLSCR